MAVNTTSMTKRLSTGHAVTITIPGEGAVTDEQQFVVCREIVAALREYATVLERAGRADEKI